MTDERIQLSEDVRAPDGTLRAAKGAAGTIRSRGFPTSGHVGVLFDAGQQQFVEPDGGGRLFRHVPYLSCTTVPPYPYATVTPHSHPNHHRNGGDP